MSEDSISLTNPSDEKMEQKDSVEEPSLNQSDDERQFIYSEESQSLICCGSHCFEIPQNVIEKYSRITKTLDLSKNSFRTLDSIAEFTELEQLILDENHLTDAHTRFPELPHLTTLMINKNRFEDIYKLVDQLRSAYPKLNYLSLLGNEACPYRITPTESSSTSLAASDTAIFSQSRLQEDYQRYRNLIIFRIPTLQFLDAAEISRDERQRAVKLGDILYATIEAKQVMNQKNGKEQEEISVGTPLANFVPPKKPSISFGVVRQKYNENGSQGNKFIQDNDT